VAAELEDHNRWAQQLDRELNRTREIVATLQAENEEKNAWALSLTAEIAEHRRQLEDCVRLLDERQNTIDERSRWAQTESAKRQRLEQQLAMVRESRWVKLGRGLRVGPEIERP
jgi:hypothetical protein